MNIKIAGTDLKLVILFSCISLFFIPEVQGQFSDCIHKEDFSEIGIMSELIRTLQHKKAEVYVDSILTELKDKDLLDCEITFWVYLVKGELYEYTEQTHLAIEIYHQITPEATINGWHELLAETYISLGRSHETRGRALDAKRNLDEAKFLIDSHELEKSRARLNLRSSSYYRIFERRPDTAMVLARLAVLLGKKHNRPRSQTDGYMLLGMLESDKPKRIEYYEKSRKVFINTKAYHGAAVMNTSIAGLYRDLGHLDDALKSIRYSLKLEDKHIAYTSMYAPTHLRHMSSMYRMTSAIYKDMNLQDSARYYADLAQEFNSKVKLDYDQEKINQLEIKSAVDIEKIKSKTLSNKLQMTEIGILIALLGLIILAIALYIIFKNRNEIRAKNKLIANQIDELSKLNMKQGILLSEVHHRIKNNLQNVISLLILQESKMEDPDFKLQIKEVSNKIFSIALIHEQLYSQGEFDSISMEVYFSDLVRHYKSLARLDQQIEFKIETQEISLNIETGVPLGLATAELITNSLKHSSAQHGLLININLSKLEDGKYRFTYFDNGIGFPDEVLNDEMSGMGVMLIRSMSRQLKAKATMSNDKGAKTTLTFNEKIVSTI